LKLEKNEAETFKNDEKMGGGKKESGRKDKKAEIVVKEKEGKRFRRKEGRKGDRS
jgi:hypothetical protein